MKRWIAFVCLAVLPAAVFGQGSQQMIKQRAKDISNQNNAQQGVQQPQANPAPPKAPAPPPVPPAVRKLQADFAALKTNSLVASEQKQELIKDLTADIRGGGKPSQLSLAAFAGDLATALAGRNLSPAQHLSLAQNIYSIFNNANLSETQKQAIFDNVQVILQTGGASRPEATATISDLKIIDFEIQKPASK
jgi:hypothetical protein